MARLHLDFEGREISVEADLRHKVVKGKVEVEGCDIRECEDAETGELIHVPQSGELYNLIRDELITVFHKDEDEIERHKHVENILIESLYQSNDDLNKIESASLLIDPDAPDESEMR